MSCLKIYNLGCFLSCDTISVNIGLADGEYSAVFTVGSSSISADIEVSDEVAVLDSKILPLGREILVSFYQDNDIQSITIDEIEYSEFKIKLNIPAQTGSSQSNTGNSVVVRTVTAEFDPIDNGQIRFVDISVPGLALGQNYTISRATDLSDLEDDFVMISEKVVKNNELRVYVQNESGEDGVQVPEITYKIYL